MTYLTRAQAIAKTSLALVESAEKDNKNDCEPSNRIGFSGSWQGDSRVEYIGSACDFLDDRFVFVSIHYHVPSDVADDNAEDISSILWDDYIVGYSIS